MERIELLLPAGDRDSLRAAVANGADAVYLGLEAFNARRLADNFRIATLPSTVEFCHKKGVKVFVTANVLVKNRELEDYFTMVAAVGQSGADALIIQDPCLIPLIREHAPECEVHLSTQATTNNIYAVPEGADRIIVPRELGFEEIAGMAKHIPVEMFVHGALCLGYSGQCLFSSIAGARSGNRGRCAQPCRQKYNGTFPLSTRDLCLLEKLPEVIVTGAVALKVEGRMRGSLYTGTVARVYRKYIDMHYSGKFAVDPKDIETLKMAFNREFTTGFAFNDSVVEADFAMNRGICLGVMRSGELRLEADLRVGDGVMALHGGKKSGNTVRAIMMNGAEVQAARKGDSVVIDVKGARDGDRIFKTFSTELKVDLGEDFEPVEERAATKRVRLPPMPAVKAPGQASLFVRVHTPEGAKEADRAGAAAVYYDIFSKEIAEARDRVKSARFFLSAPRIMSGSGVEDAIDIIKKIGPDGIMVGERGLLTQLQKTRIDAEIHLDQSLNVFNDIDLATYPGIPVISPELNFAELAEMKSKRFIVSVHGPMVLMTAREPIRDRVLRDESGRTFRTRKSGEITEVLNCSDLGLFNKTAEYLGVGIKWFHLDLDRDVGKFVKIYRRIIAKEQFDDRNIRKGFTTGHFGRGVD
ncbi:MAG: U32 family peptidase [Thermoplasmata archaeon]|nr:U32 family peptidase [Thermoplasmata archaeon]